MNLKLCFIIRIVASTTTVGGKGKRGADTVGERGINFGVNLWWQ